jgi:hypothetical protein
MLIFRSLIGKYVETSFVFSIFSNVNKRYRTNVIGQRIVIYGVSIYLHQLGYSCCWYPMFEMELVNFDSTCFFSSSTNFKMELKAQLGSCRPFSTNRLHLLSNVGPSREIALKNRLNLLKYDSLV